MSQRYECQECGHRWWDVKMKGPEHSSSIRCIRCESNNYQILDTHGAKNNIMISVLGVIGFGVLLILGFIIANLS